jgi:magnesium transporter
VSRGGLPASPALITSLFQGTCPGSEPSAAGAPELPAVQRFCCNTVNHRARPVAGRTGGGREATNPVELPGTCARVVPAMITIYKSTDQGLEVISEVTRGCWVNVVDPTADEIAQLKELGIPPEFITYPLDLDERARVEREDGELLILLRAPFYQGPTADIPYATMPLGVVLDSQWILTISRRSTEVLQELAAGRVRGLSTAKRNRFILHLLHLTASKYLSYLREINKALDILEDQLQVSTRNKELLGILRYQKSLVYFTEALRSNELMMERLQRGQFFTTYPDDEDLLEDALTENQQAIAMTNITTDILSSTMDAFASIISNNVNIVMKFLAAATIILMIPNILSSFWGMNVGVPMANWPWAFPVILGLSVLLALLVARIFIRRDWM